MKNIFYKLTKKKQSLRDNGQIKKYNKSPEPIFYGSGDLFMGVELEIDKGWGYNIMKNMFILKTSKL